MRYSLLGGAGYVAENAGHTLYRTYSPPDSTLLTVRSCNEQSIENGLAVSEYQMMYNDATCCNNGHRDNILNPFHNEVSIGIAYNDTNSAIYFTEDFQNDYLSLTTPIYSGGTVTLSGSIRGTLNLNTISVYHDPTPGPMTISQLDATFAYDPGTQIGGVFTPSPSGYTCPPTLGNGGIAAYATSWSSTEGELSIQFSLSAFTAQYGSGVYTFYLFDSNGNEWTSLSVFV